MVSFSFKLASSWLDTGTEIRAKQSLENRNNEEVGYHRLTRAMINWCPQKKTLFDNSVNILARAYFTSSPNL